MKLATATQKAKAEIISEIENYIEKNGGQYSDWYAGITNDVERRLFGEHEVVKGKNLWIHRRAVSDTIAREIEDHFHDRGCQGDSGGGDDDSEFVYAYKIASNTVE